MPRAGLGGWSSLRADKVQAKHPVRPCQVACASLYRAEGRGGVFKFGRGCDVASPKGESRGLPGSVNFWIPRNGNWLVAHGGFFCDENMKVLEARSILCPVRYADSRYPLGRFLIFSDNLALVLALGKGRSNSFSLLSVWLQGFVSCRSRGYRQSGIIPTREVASLTVVMTRANHFFVFLQSFYHGLQRHGQMTKTGFLPH